MIAEGTNNDSKNESNTDKESCKQSEPRPRPSTSGTNSDPGNRPKELKFIRKKPSTKNNLPPKTKNHKKVGLAANKCKKVDDNKHSKGTYDPKKKEDAINSLWKKVPANICPTL